MTATPKRLEQTWRWFGPNDPVPLSHVAQAGATGIVTSLHQIPYGEVWSSHEIQLRNAQIQAKGLRWSVVESVQVHDEIKRRGPKAEHYLAQYRDTLRNLGEAGIRTVCYNFMPVLDWSRTDLYYPLRDESLALRFDQTAYRAFDLGILNRRGAREEYTADQQRDAEQWLAQSTPEARQALERTMLAGLPGTDVGYTLAHFRSQLEGYEGISAADLKSNLYYFVQSMTDVAEAYGISLTIHPDDPPFSLFGLPRILSTLEDARELLAAVPSPSNTLCFCTGSFGARRDNDVPAMIEALAPQVGFVHLRNTITEPNGSFYESDHLDGDTDMYAVMLTLVKEQQGRDTPLPFRPDHGHVMLDDLGKVTNPGYSAIGRLRGLAELRGLELGILRSLF
jgi:mannonate dehydratase